MPHAVDERRGQEQICYQSPFRGPKTVSHRCHTGGQGPHRVYRLRAKPYGQTSKLAGACNLQGHQHRDLCGTSIVLTCLPVHMGCHMRSRSHHPRYSGLQFLTHSATT